MTERLDQYLDGALDRMGLTPGERAAADAVERATEDARAFVEARQAPDLTARVMRSIARANPAPVQPVRHAVRRMVETVWTARSLSVQFRPLYGLLAAAAVVALVALRPGLGSVTDDGASGVNLAAPSMLTVQFRLQAADASDVRLAGSFTDWQARYALHESAPGVWAVTLLLPSGVHEYSFVVDGDRWVPDPYAPSVDDGFGGTNSRLVLLPVDESRS